MIKETVCSSELLEATENALYTYDYYITQGFDFEDGVINQCVKYA